MAKDKSTRKKAPKADKKAAHASAKTAGKASARADICLAADLADLPDDELLEAVQRQTFRFFWEGAEPVSGMARDRTTRTLDTPNDLVTTGGTGFGVMSMIVAMERGWISRAEGLA